MFYRKIISLFLITTALFALPLSSCSQSSAEPERIIEKMKAEEASLPAGTVYVSHASEGERGHIPRSLVSAMFGGGIYPEELMLAESFALFIPSGKVPCEFAVFRCYAASDAPTLAAMCMSRLGYLRTYYRGTEFEHYTENAAVKIYGKYVIMAISSDTSTALAAAKKAAG